MRALVRARPDPGVRSIRRALPRRRRAVDARPATVAARAGDPAGSRRAPHHLAVALAAVALTATLAPATAAGAAACGSALPGPRVRRDVEACDDVRPDPRAAPARPPTPAQRPPSDARGDGPRGEHGARRRVLPRRRRPRPRPRGGLRRARRRRGARLGLRRRRLGRRGDGARGSTARATARSSSVPAGGRSASAWWRARRAGLRGRRDVGARGGPLSRGRRRRAALRSAARPRRTRGWRAPCRPRPTGGARRARRGCPAPRGR